MLMIHIISGFAALFFGAVAILTRKGKGAHIRAGRTYFWSMILVSVSAIYLALANAIPFLFLIAVLSYYLTWSGYKAIHWKNKSLPAVVFWFDVVVMHLVALFGTGTLIFSGEDLLLFYRKPKRSKFLWMYTHIGRMMGAYIATFTAFLVVNAQFFPSPMVTWLAPTVFGTPVIFYWIRRYRKKFESTKPGRRSVVS